ncbi:MAG: hypothetical protein IKB79_03385 [Oscillospiraceae bacterium]|nr:hypothetical protein [Oscillospiraceae bacterium]
MEQPVTKTVTGCFYDFIFSKRCGKLQAVSVCKGKKPVHVPEKEELHDVS